MKGKGKAIVGIVLAAIMLASVFVALMPTVSAYDPRFDIPKFPEIQTPPDRIGIIDLDPNRILSTCNPLKPTLESTIPKINYFSQPKTISTWKPLELTIPKINYFSQPKTISTWKPEWWSKNVPFTPKDMNTLQKHYDNIYKQPLQWHSSYKPISTYTSYTPMRTNFNSFRN